MRATEGSRPDDEDLADLAAELRALRGDDAADAPPNATPDEIRTLFDLSREMLVIAGFDGRFELVSAAWTANLGYTRAELCAVPFLDFVHPDDRAMTATVSERLTQNGRLVAFQNRYRHKDGTYRDISWRATVNVNKQRFYAVAMDVTERVATHERASQLAAILDASGEAIIVQSVNGIITSWNPAAERLCGSAADEAVGQPVGMVAETGLGLPELREQLARGESTERREAVLRHKDGRPVPVSVALAPFGDGTGRITGAVAIARAIGG